MADCNNRLISRTVTKLNVAYKYFVLHIVTALGKYFATFLDRFEKFTAVLRLHNDKQTAYY
jgi:hypothetical protein